MPKRQKGRIDVKVDDPQQLIDTMDPFPFRERGLDDDVDAYICEHAEALAPDTHLSVAIHLPAAQVSGTLAQSLPGIVQRHFAGQAERRSAELKKLFARGRTTLVIGLVMLGLCLAAGQALVGLFPHSRIASVMMEGLVILGWVANWQPMEIFLFDWWPLLRERRLYRRLAAAPVTVVAQEGAPPAAA